MEIEEFSQIIKENMSKIDIELNNVQIKQFFSYMNLLIEWNKKINLTAIIEPKEIIIKHFVDCGTIFKYIEEKDNVIDVGTGAGFPGIPIKILNNKINITLVDSLNKRINFLSEVVNELELKNVKVIHGRAEDLAQNKEYREKYDKAISRAVANLSTLSEYDLPFVKINGKMIAMKGFEIEEELGNAKKAIEILGGKIEKVEKFSLIDTENKRSIVLINKLKSTPRQYPRKAGRPSKEPIK